jgi:hypothetical protein
LLLGLMSAVFGFWLASICFASSCIIVTKFVHCFDLVADVEYRSLVSVHD